LINVTPIIFPAHGIQRHESATEKPRFVSTRPDQGFTLSEINTVLVPNLFASSKLSITCEHILTHRLRCQPAPILLAKAGTRSRGNRGNDNIENRMFQGTLKP